MGISVDWDDEGKNVIRHTYKNDWELRDYINVAKQTYEMIDDVDHIVHLLTILEDGQGPSFNLITAARDHRVENHPRRGWHVIIGANRVIKMTTRILGVIHPAAKTVKFARTQAEAYKIFEDATADKRND